jgi:perosamine synthetase
MPEVAAALGLAQTERMEHFVKLRVDIGNMYLEAMQGCDYLVPQRTPKNWLNTYWTFAARYVRKDVSWQQFRKKYIEFGGDGIYAAWALTYEETLMAEGHYRKHCPMLYDKLHFPRGICPVAEELQPQLMQFVTNYGSLDEAKPMVDALHETIKFFGR